MSTDKLQQISYRAQAVEFAKARLTRAEKDIEEAVKEKQAAEMDISLQLKQFQDACNGAIDLRATDPSRAGFAPSFIR